MTPRRRELNSRIVILAKDLHGRIDVNKRFDDVKRERAELR